MPTEIPATPDWTTTAIATKIEATTIPNATLPFASSFCSSTSFVILPKTENPIYSATTARMTAMINWIIPTTAFTRIITSPHFQYSVR